MPVNDYQTFACDPAANVESQATYVSDPTRSTGEVSGKANSARSNKAWRQPSMWASALGMFLNDQGQDALDDGNPSNLMGKLKLALGSWISASVASLINVNGQCRFNFIDATHCTLGMCNGNRLKIAGVIQKVPNAGVTITNAGLTANTFYYAYAFMNAGAMALEFSTIGHVADTAAGNEGTEIKLGDNSRTLVGAVGTDASSQWSWGRVISWFNRRRKVVGGQLLSQTTTASTTPVEISTQLRFYFLEWADDSTDVLANGTISSTVDTNLGVTQWIGIDGTARGGNSSANCAGTGLTASITSVLSVDVTTCAENAIHYATLMASTNPGQTATYSSSTNGTTANLQVILRG